MISQDVVYFAFFYTSSTPDVARATPTAALTFLVTFSLDTTFSHHSAPPGSTFFFKSRNILKFFLEEATHFTSFGNMLY